MDHLRHGAPWEQPYPRHAVSASLEETKTEAVARCIHTRSAAIANALRPSCELVGEVKPVDSVNECAAQSHRRHCGREAGAGPMGMR